MRWSQKPRPFWKFAMVDPTIWLNGVLEPAGSARIDPTDRGLTLGDGLFETLRARGGVPCHAGLHLARLRKGAGILGIDVPLDNAQILAAFEAVLAANGLTDAVLRLTLTRGVGPRGIAPSPTARPTLLITASAMAAMPETLSAIICQSTRRNEFSPLSGVKSLNYLDNIIARREAIARAANDAILLNTQGFVAEACVANVFVFKNGKWLTPFVNDGALPGIFRGRLLVRRVVAEGRIMVEDLSAADCVCLGNTLSLGVVTMLDGLALKTDPEASAVLRTILNED
jgi:branched-chain amino acid aminotransferase